MGLSEELLREYKEAYQIPPLLLNGLVQREALPPWAAQSIEQRVDWLSALHRACTEKEWPKDLREAGAGLLEHGCNLGAAEICEQAKAIVMPVCTPVYLRLLFEIIALPMVFPTSPDPDAKMVYDETKLTDSVRRLTHLSGMLGDTGYADAPAEYWGGAVTLATRFLYYHELGHLSRARSCSQDRPEWVTREEEYLTEELVADQFAIAMLTLELKRQTALQSVGFVGIALAFSFVALKEFSDTVLEGGRRSTKDATLRMHRLLWWGRLTVGAGGLAAEAVTLGEAFWGSFTALLRRIDQIPSPVFSLLMRTADRPRGDWKIASNHILRWCVFGDRANVLANIRRIRDAATEVGATQTRALEVLKVVDFLLSDTAHFEPTLGMRAVLER